MTNEKVSVLIAGTGGGGTGMELIKSLKMANHEYKIVATDMWDIGFGLSETPYRYIVPPASSENYLDSILKICKKENIQAIATGSEPELKKIAQNAELFEEQNIQVLLNPWNVIELCTDKYDLIQFLQSKGISCPESFPSFPPPPCLCPDDPYPYSI